LQCRRLMARVPHCRITCVVTAVKKIKDTMTDKTADNWKLQLKCWRSYVCSRSVRTASWFRNRLFVIKYAFFLHPSRERWHSTLKYKITIRIRSFNALPNSFFTPIHSTLTHGAVKALVSEKPLYLYGFFFLPEYVGWIRLKFCDVKWSRVKLMFCWALICHAALMPPDDLLQLCCCILHSNLIMRCESLLHVTRRN
jgi:hypothetical protein